MAGDRDGPLLVEPELLLGPLQQLQEKWVVDMSDGDHEPLLLLALPHQDRQAALWDVLRLLLVLVMKVEVRKMEVEDRVGGLVCYHYYSPRKSCVRALYTCPTA